MLIKSKSNSFFFKKGKGFLYPVVSNFRWRFLSPFSSRCGHVAGMTICGGAWNAVPFHQSGIYFSTHICMISYCLSWQELWQEWDLTPSGCTRTRNVNLLVNKPSVITKGHSSPFHRA